jgi:hypothetical protein
MKYDASHGRKYRNDRRRRLERFSEPMIEFLRRESIVAGSAFAREEKTIASEAGPAQRT